MGDIQNMKKTIKALFIVFFMLTNFSHISISDFSSAATTDEIVASYVFDDNLEMEKVTLGANQYTSISIGGDDLISYTSTPGEPRLPVKGCRIAIPSGHKVENIHVIKSDLVSFSTDFKVEPAQDVVPIGYDGDINFDLPKLQIYNSDECFPNKDFEIVTEQIFRGYKFLVLNIFPIKYRSLSNKLDFYRSMKVKVKISPVSSLEDTDVTYRGLQKDINLFKDMVDNSEQIKDSSLSYYKTRSPTDEIYEYVIITTESLKNSYSGYTFQDLANAKETSGLNTKIMTIEEIKDDYTGSSTEEKIRNFIKYAYKNWQTDYVLLGGDSGKVPVKIVTVDDEGWPNHKSSCDLYYACLDSPAPDGTSNCDLTAEVYVGRAPVDSTSEVSNFVEKTLDYMDTSNDYIKKALWIGEELGRGMLPGKKMLEQCIGHCEEDGYVTDGLPEGYGEYEYAVERLYVGYQPKNYANNKLNSGNYHLINYIGHSNSGLAIGMSSSQASSLSNDNRFFIYGQSCDSGMFTKNDCFAEHLLVKSKYGAFGVIMNYGHGHQFKGSTNGPTNNHCRQFWDAIYGEKTPIFGQAYYDSKYDNLNKIHINTFLWTHYSVVFLGDPSLVVKNTEPSLMYSPHYYDFDSMEKGETASTTFKIWNNGIEEVDYFLSEDKDWISVSPTQGSSSSGKRNIITVNVDTTGLSDGKHYCHINIDSDIGSGVFVVSVKVGAVLAFYPRSFTKCVSRGEQLLSSFNIKNDGLDTLSFTLNSSVNWLTVSPESGECESNAEIPEAILIGVDTADLENGYHHGSISIFTNAGNDTFGVKIGVGGPNKPVNIKPKDNASGVGADVELIVMVEDPDGDSMSVSFYNALDDSLIDSESYVDSGDNAKVVWSDRKFGTTYSWYAIADDGEMTSRSDVFSFTTNFPPKFSNFHPIDGALDASIFLDKLSIDINDPEGDAFSWSISIVPSTGSNYSNDDFNGTKFCDADGLLPDTEYKWIVNATDSRGATYENIYSFKTEENYLPSIPRAIYPSDGISEINISDIVLNWSCNDPNKDDYLFYTVYFGKTKNPELYIENITETFYSINYDFSMKTTYYWKIKATDRFGATNESKIFSFTTSSVPPSPKPGDIDILFSKKVCSIGVKADIINSADSDVSNVYWYISVTGGILDNVDVSNEGSIYRLDLDEVYTISTYRFLNVKSNVIGFGEVDIAVSVADEDGEIVCEKSCKGYVFGLLTIIRN